jgi:hypothetical protein
MGDFLIAQLGYHLQFDPLWVYDNIIPFPSSEGESLNSYNTRCSEAHGLYCGSNEQCVSSAVVDIIYSFFYARRRRKKAIGRRESSVCYIQTAAPSFSKEGGAGSHLRLLYGINDDDIHTQEMCIGFPGARSLHIYDISSLWARVWIIIMVYGAKLSLLVPAIVIPCNVW